MPARARIVLLAVCLGFAACAVRAHSAGFAIVWSALGRQAAAMSALAALLGFYSAKRRAPGLRLALEAALWTIALSSLFNFPMYVLLRQGSGFADSALARADGALGVSVPALVRFVAAHPWLEHSLQLSYDSLRVVSVLSILLPALLGRAERTAQLLVALALSALVSLLFLARFRAVGPWALGDFAASPAQVGCEALLRALDRGDPLTIDVSRSAPLIAFPSWHALLALLSAASLSPLRGVGPLASVWALLVAFSTLSTGWHYAVDTLAGLAVGLASFVAARFVLRASFTLRARRAFLLEK